jgi:hypothetical protein
MSLLRSGLEIITAIIVGGLVTGTILIALRHWIVSGRGLGHRWRLPSFRAPTVGPKPVKEKVVITHNLARLTLEQASRLAGKRHCYRVRLADVSLIDGRRVSYECEGQDDVLRMVLLPDGGEYDVGDEILVVAVLAVIEHKARAGLEGSDEIRLTQAEVVCE